jgi:glutathione S-transferase
VPWIVHGSNTVSDSSFIIDYLLETYAADSKYLGDIRLDLSDTEAAIHTALQRLCEDSLVHVGFYHRFVDEVDSAFDYPPFLAKVPGPIRVIAFKWLRVMMYRQQYAIGFARFNEAERFAIQRRNVDALVTLLGQKTYFGGDRPAKIDCTVFALLDNIVNYPVPFGGLRDHILKQQNLVEYVQRIRDCYFSDSLT